MANGQQIQVGIKFTADTAQAKQQIQTLQNTLQQISNTPITVQGGGIEQAVQAANQLHVALSKAVNVNTGKLNFAELNKSLVSMGTNVTEVGNKLLSMGPQGQKAFQQLAQSISQAEIPAKRLNGVFARFGDTLLRTIRWQVASSLIHGFMSTVSQAVSYIEKLDKSLNSIQIVTQKSDSEMAHFAKTANKAAGELSAVTKEYTDASLIFFQQGLDTKEVIERTNATVKLAKVTGDSIDAVSSKLTAIWNNFDDGTQSLEYYVDVITALGASTAASSDEIATGLQKFSAVADTVGLSYEKATAALATVVAQTRQSADVVGTSFKTIFARIEGLKLGETLDDGVTLNQYSSALAKIGVNILDSNNELKDMDTILNDIGERWNKISKSQQVALAQTVGGLRQYQQFIAMMDNYDKVLENQEIAENSKGTLDKQFKTYQDSIEALDKQIEKAKQDVFGALFNADDLKGFKEELLKALESVQRIVRAVGGLKGIIIFVTTLLMERAIPSIQTGISNMIASFKTFRADAEGALSSFQGLAAAQTSNVNSKNVQSSINGEIGKHDANYVDAQSQSLYYTQQILQARQQLLSNSQNMTEEQKIAIQQQIDYLSKLAESANIRREELDILRDQLQAQKDIIATENGRQAYYNQMEENKEQRNEQENKSPFWDQTQKFTFNSSDANGRIQILDEYKQKIQETINRYQELAEKEEEDGNKKILTDRIEELKVYIKLLEEAKTKQNESGQLKVTRNDLNTMNADEAKFRQEHQSVFSTKSASDAAKEASNPNYSMGIVVDKFSNAALGEASSGLGSLAADGAQIQEILTSVGMLKQEAGEINFNNANADNLADKLNVSETSVEKLSKESAKYVNTSKKLQGVQKDLVASDKQRQAIEGAINKNSKTYEKNMASIVVQQKKAVNNAKDLAKNLNESTPGVKKLNDKLTEVEKTLGEGKTLSGQQIKELDEAMTEAANGANTTGKALQSFNNAVVESANTTETGRQALQKVADEAYQVQQKTDEATLAEQRFNEVMQSLKAPTGLESFAQGLGTTIQTITSATQAVQMMTSGVNMLSDAFSGNGDAVSILSGLMMTLRGIMLAYNVTQTAAMAIGKLLIKQDSKRIKQKVTETMTQKGLNAEKKAEVTLEIWNKSVKQFGVVAGIALAGVATAAMIASVAVASGSKKSAAAYKSEAEAASKVAETSKEKAQAQQEEAKKARELYDNYKKLYDTYKETGESSTDLYKSGLELINTLDIESAMITLLAKDYDSLNRQLREAIINKNKLASEASSDSFKKSLYEIRAQIKSDYGEKEEGIVNKGELFAKAFGDSIWHNWFGFDFSWGDKKQYIASKEVSDEDLENLAKFFNLTNYKGLSEEDLITQLNSKLLKKYGDNLKINEDGELISTNTEFTGLSAISDFYQDYRAYLSENELTDNFTFDEASYEVLEKIKEQQDEVKEQVNSSILPSLILETGIDQMSNIEEISEQINKIFDENGNIQKESQLYTEIAKLLNLNPDTQQDQIDYIIQSLLPDLQKQFLSQTKYSDILLAEEQIKKAYNQDINFDEIAKQAGLTLEEVQELFASGIDLNIIDWNAANPQEQLANILKQLQKQANEDTIEIKYELTQTAKKNWKKSMTASEYKAWFADENNKELLEQLGISAADFMALSYDEQIHLLNSINTLEDVQTEKQNKIDDYTERLTRYKNNQYYADGKYINKEEYKKNQLQNKYGYEAGLELYQMLDDWESYEKENNISGFDDAYEYLDWLKRYDTEGNMYYSPNSSNAKKYRQFAGFSPQVIAEIENGMDKEAESWQTALEEAQSSYNLTQNYAPIVQLSEQASASGLNTDDILDLANELPTLAKNIDELNISEQDSAKTLQQVSLAIKQTQKGLDTLTSSYDDWKEALKSKDELKKITALSEMKAAFADILNITDELAEEGMTLGDHFGNYLIEHLDTVEKAADGDKQAILELSRVATEDILLQIKPNIQQDSELWSLVQNQMDEIQTMLDNNKLKIGKVDDTELINSLDNMIAELGLSTDEAATLLASMGFNAEFEEKEVPITEQVWIPPRYRQGSQFSYGAENSFDTIEGPLENTGVFKPVTTTKTVTALKVDSLNYTGGGNISTKIGGTGRRNNSGGSSRSPKELKKSTDEIDRYHVVDKTIDSLSKKYSRLSAAKDAAFGKERLKYIEQENKLLQQQYKAEKDRLKEVEKYYAEDRAAIEAYGAKIDNNGVITNYDQIMQQQLDKLNSKYEQYNAGGLSDEIIEAAEKDYEDFKKILSQFEETNSTYLDQLKKVEDAIREQLSHELEAIKAKVELELELPDEQIKLIEFKLQDLEDRAFKSAEKIALWGDKAEQAASKFNSYLNGFKEFLSMGIEDEEGNLLGGFNLTDEQIEAIMHGNIEALKEAGVTGDNANEIIEALKEYEDNLIETYQTIVEMRSSIEEELFNQLSEYTEAIETQINKLDKLNSITNNIKTLMGTVGKETLGITSEIIKQIDRNIAAANKSQIQIMRKEQESLQISLDEAKQKLQEAITRNDTEAIEYWKKANTEIENQLLDTTDNLLSKINDFVEQMVENISQTIQDGFNDFAKSIYGMTLEDAQASYDRYKTLSDDYLKDYQKIYELSKLTRNIEKSINDTDNLNAKQKLRDLQEEINKYQAEGIQMTKYEVDYLTKKYELRQAEIALQEAQNAKDQVRLARNADGGWGYIYTANQESIDKAQQTYEDKLYALQELNQQTIEETQSTILQLQKEFEDAILETIQNTNLSEKEKQARISELQQYYLQRMQIYYNTLNTALNNNREVYEKDWTAYNQLIGYRISADKDYIDKFNETWLGQQTGLIAGITTVEEAFQMYQEGLGSIDGNGVLGETYAALEEYEQNINNLLGEVGLSGQISNYMDIISGKIKEADNAGSVLATTLGEELPDTINQIDDFQKKFNDRIEKMKNSIEKANEAVRTLIAYLSGLDDVDFGVNINASITASGLKDQVINAIRETVKDAYLNPPPDGGNSHGGLGSGGAIEHLEGQSQTMFNTGGYTGEWGPDGRLAMLHEKELVLNKDDTENMLKMVNLARDTINTISLGNQLNAYKATLLGKHQISTNNMSQSVSIEAHFPNVVNHLEIEEAFNNLVNYAAQSAYNFDLPDQINIF